MDTIEKRPLASLRAAERNSRKHSDVQIQQIASSMETFGWTMPVLVDEEGVLIAGHARIRAAELLGFTEAPCLVAKGWSEEKKTAYQIADNKLSENSSWDEDILREQITSLNEADFSLDVLGFPAFQLEGLLDFSDDSLFNLPTEDDEGVGELPPGVTKAKEPTSTQNGMASFSVVVPVDRKKAAFATLRKIIATGEAQNYSEAFLKAMEVADGHYP